jgi:hypothetical protein
MRFEELYRFNSKGVGQFRDDFKARVADALFKLTQIGLVDFGSIRKILLRNIFRVSKAAEIGREYLPANRWLHPASGAACRLLTHRFKSTKWGRRFWDTVRLSGGPVDLRTSANPRLTATVRGELDAARRDALRGIASTDTGRQLLRQLIGPDTYTPVGTPNVVARLYRGSDGLYLGHAKGINGEIVGNARWLKMSTVSARLLTSAAALTGHLMLIEMSNKLDRVQAVVDAIKAGQDDDRVQRLRAAIAVVEDALESDIAENRHALMTATIPQLRAAVQQMIAQLKREVADVPLPGTNWNPFVNQAEQARAQLNRAAKTFDLCIKGISILSQAYFALGHRQTGRNSALRLLKELQDTGTADVEYKARRLLPKDESDRPERIWAEFNRLLPDLIEMFTSDAEQRLLCETEELNIEATREEIIALLQAPQGEAE